MMKSICPSIASDWRELFRKDELEKNFHIIEEGGDPNEEESTGESDSEAEIDLYKEEEDFPSDKVNEDNLPIGVKPGMKEILELDDEDEDKMQESK